MGDFNAVTGTERFGYDIGVGPHGSGTRNDNSSFLLHLARSRRLRIVGSWYQRPMLHCWTWYSNDRRDATISLSVLVGGSSRTSFLFLSAKFCATDHKLFVATLKLHGRPRKSPRYDHTLFHFEKSKNLTCAQEYVMPVSSQFGVLNTLHDLVELWDTFKCETLEAAEEFVGEHPRSRSGFASVETLDSTKES